MREKELLISGSFLKLSKTLFALLACSTLILFIVTLFYRLGRPDDEVVFRVVEVVAWIVVPILAFLVGYYAGVSVQTEEHRKDKVA
jgi:hypothetical protein